jgi:hypothetical protein
MSDWTWEYVPDAARVVGGLTTASLRRRSMRRNALQCESPTRPQCPGSARPFDIRESVSNLQSHGEGPVMIWFLEDYRENVVLVVRVQQGAV